MEAQERSMSANMPFIRDLASSNRKIRTSALESLQRFLTARSHSGSLSQTDILALWKGLFFSMWMCDRPLPQQALAGELADLLATSIPRRTDAAAAWLTGFWAIMSREWTGIDALRMEKFLLLVRRILGAMLKWCEVQEGAKSAGARRRWDVKSADAMVGVLREWPLRCTGSDPIESADEDDEAATLIATTPVPAGLTIHVVDIWVDEVEKAGLLGDQDNPEPSREAQEILKKINGAVDELANETTSTAVRLRSREALADDRLPWNKGQTQGGAEDGAAESGSWDGFDD